MLKYPLISLIVPLCALTLPIKSDAAPIFLKSCLVEDCFRGDVVKIPRLNYPSMTPQDHPTTQERTAQNVKTYQVQLGDTVSGIAVKFGLSVDKLLEYNPSLKSNPILLQIGQWINLTPTSQPEPTRQSTTNRRQSAFTSLNIPEQRRTGSRSSATKRGFGACLKNPEQPLRILLPETNFGYTLQDYPTFFWYMPKLTADSPSIEFSLRSVVNNNVIYEGIISNPTPDIIASFSLPTDAPALKEGEEYEWEIALNCSKNNVLRVRGRIQRLTTNNPSLRQKLETAAIQDYPAILAQQGIWYDALTTLAALKRENPNDESLKKDWGEILEKIGYKDLKSVQENTVTLSKKTK